MHSLCLDGWHFEERSNRTVETQSLRHQVLHFAAVCEEIAQEIGRKSYLRTFGFCCPTKAAASLTPNR
jgi:hypothetical protein